MRLLYLFPFILVIACSSEQGSSAATPCEPGFILPCDCVFSTGIAVCDASGAPGICQCSVRYVGSNPDAYSDLADGAASDGQARGADTSGASDAGGVKDTTRAVMDTNQQDTSVADAQPSDSAAPPDTSSQADTSVMDATVSDAANADAGSGCTYTLTTLAGSSSVGNQDGKGNMARFNSPRGLYWSSTGQLLVADRSNHRVRSVTSDGVVSTIAGSGLGSTTGAKGKFAYPAGVYEDGGVIWVADASNDQIRQIANGEVTVVAGTGTQGSTDGDALNKARFTKPQAVVKAPDGSLWVADTHNHRIRRISQGVVSTIAGSSIGGQNGKGSMARFSYPKDLDFLGAFALVADRHNHEIRKVQVDGTVTTFAGGAKGDKDGPVDVARFNEPCGVAVDPSGVVWVADRDNDLIRRIANGAVTTVAGGANSSLDGPFPNNGLSEPWGVAVGTAGVLYIADSDGHRIRKLTCD